ncbi:MAG TPA: SCP2 sterol-binding domain-containing protein [Acidimicrobiales bacterium]|nr:SCP2 sterol-binding domain-containing protein [Acidimicrobiales bacterium]
MPRFLSHQWIEEASAAAATSPELAEASAGVHLVVQQVVTGGPDADVTFTTDWESAVAVATGTASAQDAFTSGRLRVRGDVTALLRHARALDGLHAAFAGLRERTTY